MYWNYRIVVNANMEEENAECVFGIHRVYYDTEDNIVGWEDEPIISVLETEENNPLLELRNTLELLNTSFTSDVVDIKELKSV